MSVWRDIKVPAEGPRTREHVFAAISRMEWDLQGVLLSCGAYETTSERPSALTQEENRRLMVLRCRVGDLAQSIDPNPLDRMVAIKEESLHQRDANVPEDVYDIVHGFTGDVDAFCKTHTEAENLVLAFSVLSSIVGLDGETVQDLIPKIVGKPDRMKSKVWTCPVCEGHMRLYQKQHGKPCRRCCGWGYVFGDEPVEERAALEAAQAEEEDSADADGGVDS